MHFYSITSVLSTLPLLSTALTVNHGLRPRDLAVTTNLQYPWVYQGCFVDVATDRQLVSYYGEHQYVDSKNMTQDSCIAFCYRGGYGIAGLEWGQECFCADVPGPLMQYRPSWECDFPCTGNSSQACGGGQRLTLFMFLHYDPRYITRAPLGWAYSGCYSDGPSRSLPVPMAVPGPMTVPACLEQCKAAGYLTAGVEYSNECWCGDKLSSQATLDPNGCTMPCTGDNPYQCGGGWRMNVYQQVTGPAPLPAGCEALPNNCYIDTIFNHTLAVRVVSQPDLITVASCLTTCRGQGYKYSGVKYASECWCGNTVGGEGPRPDGQEGCNMPCSGNTGDMCGGPNGINLYQCSA